MEKIQLVKLAEDTRGQSRSAVLVEVSSQCATQTNAEFEFRGQSVKRGGEGGYARMDRRGRFPLGFECESPKSV